MSEKSAPGELDLVREFVNTLDAESGADELATPAALASWLRDRALLDRSQSTSRAESLRAREVREAIRTLLLSNNGEDVDTAEAAAVLDAQARRSGVALRFEPGGTARLVARQPGIDAALGRILAMIASAMETGAWSRLKACRGERCGWAFFDRTKNRSGVWCAMEVCGNRAKVRSYRARHGHDHET